MSTPDMPPVSARWRPSVLVADDVEANLTSFEALLSDLDCEIVLAHNGEEALRHLLKRQFAVLLLDVQMPGMDGYEVARHVRMHPLTKELPIIFATATHSGEGSVLRGYGSGAVDYLMKPINPAVLRSKVKVFLDLYSSRRVIADAKAQLEQSNAQLEAAYRELQATQAQLVQSAKMASLGQLVAGVAHEINNPLAFVVSHLGTALRSLEGMAGLIGDDVKVAQDFHKAQSRLAEMDVGLQRIRDLVLKLKTFSRLEESERTTVSLRESVDSVLTILGHRLRGRIQVETDFSERDMLRCYGGALNQAIMNLVSNSIDAIKGSGNIWVKTEQSDRECRISVADTGSGIPEALRERVLEPFFTTKPIGEGTGLGLSITYSIVKKHGGQIEIHDREGGGTRVVLRLPVEAA